MGTIKLLNTNRHMSVTVRSFDSDEVTLPAGQKEPVEVDEKFGWMLPAGVKNKSSQATLKNQDLTADPDALEEKKTEEKVEDSNKPVENKPVENKATAASNKTAEAVVDSGKNDALKTLNQPSTLAPKTA